MNQKQFLQEIEDTYKKALKIVKLKNSDYATNQDPWKNFRSAEIVGVDVKRAILVRTLDKMSRIGNLLEKSPHVIEEKIDDTILDAINYLAILLAKIKDEQKEAN
jgi:hypothetical protein